MNKLNLQSWFFLAVVSVVGALTGCGNAETIINEKAAVPSDDGHNHGDQSDTMATGRLLIVNPAKVETQVYDLNDGDLLTSISLASQPSAVYATGGFRFAALLRRDAGSVGFIDGGLWQEAHDDHFDSYSNTPSLSNFSLEGSRPTHFQGHQGQVALFMDGDDTTGANASVQVFDDHAIEAAQQPATLEFLMPQHGVAEPRGEYLVTSIRREDAQTTSSNVVLPDQVGVYHRHDGAYELEQTFAATCPDLHGATQNDAYVIFGCSDGLLLVSDNGDGTYGAQKLANSDEVAEGLRFGSLWGHHESGQFFGQASSSSSDSVQLFMIDPAENLMELIDWQPMPGAKAVVQGFSSEAEQFVVLDDQGYLTLIEPHTEAGRTHWEYGANLAITQADVSLMPEAMNFSMTFSQNHHIAYIADPIEQHVLAVDLALLQVIDDIELDYAPGSVTWLGIAQEHDH